MARNTRSCGPAITNWSMQLTLSSGLNDLTLQAFDASGNPLANDTGRIRETFNGQSGSPARPGADQRMDGGQHRAR